MVTTLDIILICIIAVLILALVRIFLDSRKQSKELQTITDRLKQSGGALNEAVKKNTPK